MNRSNSRIRLARQVRDGKIRKDIFIEGVRLCEEALLADLWIHEALATEKILDDERSSQLLEEIRQRGLRVSIISEKVMNSISATKATQGIILIARRPLTGKEILENDLDTTPLVVIVHGMNNPSNAGAILRTAEAAGATALIATTGTTYLFAPKALRGAMGSTFRMPLWLGAEYGEALLWCRERGISTVATAALGTKTFSEITWTEPRAIIIGPEASGLTVEEINAADESIRIPMRQPVESLNAAVACGIILYEAARQRGET
ncbi:MAG TPA: RNA methyltransferase [Pyrinomonadaceae bacterium]|nr:RNA methyltransferase [Pyrinomonadaceae bacterium]